MKGISQLCGVRALLWVGLALCCLSSAVMAQTSLEQIDFASLPGSRFQVELEFSAPPPTPESFMLEAPARLTMDFAGVSSALEQRRYALNFNQADSVVILEAQGRTRMIVNLQNSMPYETRIEGNMLYVVLGAAAAPVSAAPAATQEENGASERFVTVGSRGSDIGGIDFRRGDNDSGQILIDLNRTDLSANIRQSGSRIIVEFPGASLDREQQQRLDVSDFATQVRNVSLYNEDDNVVVLAEVEGEYEFLAFQRNGQYIVNVMSAATAARLNGNEEPIFSGDPISMDFQNIEVRTILQILAEFNNFNLIMGDNVGGTMALHLDEVPWDQALDMVLRTRGLAQRQVGNVLYIAPAQEIAESERQELEASRQTEELAPLLTEYIEVNYASAQEILQLLRGSGGAVAPGAPGIPLATASGGILSSRGSASIDARTNTIIVRDIESVIEDIRRLLARLDVPVRQVLIEARIVNASTTFSDALGVRWGGAQNFPGAGDQFILSGSQSANVLYNQSVTDYNIAIAEALAGGETLENALAVTAPPVVSFPEALAVDLGVEAPTSSIAIGYSGSKGLLELELSALEASGNGEVIAQPKVTTQDQQNARIESGVQIPYQAQAGGTAGGSTTEFVTAALSLDVTPQITPDGRIIMALDIHQDSVVPGSAGAVPAIATNSVNTRVLVNDGDTIVLGGVFREEVTTSVSKTPVLGDLPYLGNLFKRTENAENKTELLIFITPSIITEAL